MSQPDPIFPEQPSPETNPFETPIVPPTVIRSPGPIAVAFSVIFGIVIGVVVFGVTFFFTCLGVTSIPSMSGDAGMALTFVVATLTGVVALVLSIKGMLALIRTFAA